MDGGERVVTEVAYNHLTLELVSNDKFEGEGLSSFHKLFIANKHMLDLSSKKTSISKSQFISGCQKIPFLFDLMRAETFWQDRRQDQLGMLGQSQIKISSLHMKTKF